MRTLYSWERHQASFLNYKNFLVSNWIPWNNREYTTLSSLPLQTRFQFFLGKKKIFFHAAINYFHESCSDWTHVQGPFKWHIFRTTILSEIKFSINHADCEKAQAHCNFHESFWTFSVSIAFFLLNNGTNFAAFSKIWSFTI